MHWIALHLPLLSLETFAATRIDAAHDEADSALALLDANRIVSVNAAAHALGVKPGLKRATALALAPRITLGQADLARDAQALLAVAHTALAFTPKVLIEPGAPDAPSHTVLLEVQASLRYFGGVASLRERLHAALAPLGHRVHMASAATPLGAALLARVHRELDCADPSATTRALSQAPVWLLDSAHTHWEALQGMGLRTIADLDRVPRAGLTRRFGERLLNEFDRAMGTQPDPREAIVPAPRFDSRLELFARVDTGEQVMHGASVLLARLIAWLQAQHAFARRFTLVMHHEPRSRRDDSPTATALEIALAEPSRDSAHLLVLLRERLAPLRLPAPTLELSLRCADIAHRAPPNTELFPTAASEHEGLTRLIERLQARLGREQVMRIAAAADQRPEHATVTRIADAAMRPARPQRTTGSNPNAGYGIGMRPVWLLQNPEPLQERADGPMLEGRLLHLLSGPERIETGWWDAGLIERDYYIAQQPDGALVWIYRARRTAAPPAPNWFLQGRFG